MVKHNLNVQAYDTNSATLAELSRLGINILERDAISRLVHTRVVLCLPEPASSTNIISKWIENGLPADAIVADITTMPPSTARRHAEMLAKSGGTYLDTPVSGGQRGAESGNMVIVAGGPRSAFEEMLPILRTIGDTVHHAGQVGSASLAKAVHQFVYLSYNLAFAHGLQLGRNLELSEKIVMDLLTNGAAAHPLINDRLPSALGSDFNEGFLLGRCLKDLDFLELAAGHDGTAVDAYERLRSEIRRAVEEGFGDRDILVLSQTKRK